MPAQTQNRQVRPNDGVERKSALAERPPADLPRAPLPADKNRAKG